jgi:hypothetical protein
VHRRKTDLKKGHIETRRNHAAGMPSLTDDKSGIML